MRIEGEHERSRQENGEVRGRRGGGGRRETQFVVVVVVESHVLTIY